MSRRLSAAGLAPLGLGSRAAGTSLLDSVPKAKKTLVDSKFGLVIDEVPGTIVVPLPWMRLTEANAVSRSKRPTPGDAFGSEGQPATSLRSHLTPSWSVDRWPS